MLVSKAILCTKIEPKLDLQHVFLKKIILICMVERPNSRTWVVLLCILWYFSTKLHRKKRYFVAKQAQFHRCCLYICQIIIRINVYPIYNKVSSLNYIEAISAKAC